MVDATNNELLAQALWMQHFGVLTIDPRYDAWQQANQAQANALRAQAASMISLAATQVTNSLQWLPSGN